MINEIKFHFYRNRHKYLAIAVTLIVLWNIANFIWCGALDLSQAISIFGQYVTAAAIFFAAYQFKANHDWNRRQLAITEAKNVRHSVFDDLLLIDKTFNYINRKKHEALPVEDIHKGMCECNEDGSLKRCKNGKLRIDHQGDGGKVDKAISHFLGAFEYLATGIVQGIFDEEVIYKLYGGPLMRAAGIFSEYIRHVNIDMYADRHMKIYENLRYVAAKFEEREKGKEEKEREKAG